MTDTRSAQLNGLLAFDRPLAEALSAVSALGWDATDTSVTLAAHHIVNILKRFLAGQLTSTQVEAWANAVECREDIAYVSGSLVGAALHELANPLLTCPLTEHTAHQLVARLCGVAT